MMRCHIQTPMMHLRVMLSQVPHEGELRTLVAMNIKRLKVPPELHRTERPCHMAQVVDVWGWDVECWLSCAED